MDASDGLNEPRKAIALISGGLDSMLAARLIADQGIHVEGINFYTGFCVEGHTHAIRNQHRAKPKRNNALWVAERLNIKLHIIDVIEQYKDVVINPKHGYGANMNPCLDCKSFMVGKARQWMEQNGFDFIITGEVIGQRPKSQRRDTMPVVARESGAFDRLLRPLCARLLPPTLPEREGWVNREKLLRMNGRSRKPQMALAKQFGFRDYAQPAGGCCFLTDKRYSHKLADLWQSRGEKRYDLDDIMLLKVGRHLRPRANFKLIVGRDDGENNFLHGYRRQYVHMFPTSHKGPLVLVNGTADASDLQLAARLTARFSQGKEDEEVTVAVCNTEGGQQLVAVRPMSPAEIPGDWYL
jgi:tRNA U34 2-thiouridine synthase MnmA/TrmU